MAERGIGLDAARAGYARQIYLRRLLYFVLVLLLATLTFWTICYLKIPI